MEAVKNWALMLCQAALVCGMVQFLLPKDKSGRAGRTAVALFFLCTLISPLAETAESWNFDLSRFQREQEELSSDLAEEQSRLAYSLAESHILELIQTRMEQARIPAEQIRVQLSEEQISVSLQLPAEAKNREGELRTLLQNCGIETAEIQWLEEE